MNHNEKLDKFSSLYMTQAQNRCMSTASSLSGTLHPLSKIVDPRLCVIPFSRILIFLPSFGTHIFGKSPVINLDSQIFLKDSASFSHINFQPIVTYCIYKNVTHGLIMQYHDYLVRCTMHQLVQYGVSSFLTVDQVEQ